MAKRIVTLDVLRGFSIFMMCGFHVFVNSAKLMDNTDAMFDNIGLLIVGLFVFLFGHFRGFFILISGAANCYVMMRGAKKGGSAGKIAARQIGGGLFLVIFGHLKDTFINQWGILRDWYLDGLFGSGTFDWSTQWSESWQLGIISEAIQSIGWTVLLTSIIMLLLIKILGAEKRKMIIVAMLVIAFAVIFVSPLIQTALGDTLTYTDSNYTITDGSTPWKVDKTGWQWYNYLLLYMIYDLGGAESPIFPMLGYCLFGAVIGIALAKDNLKKKFIGIGVLYGILLIVAGVGVILYEMFLGGGWTLDVNFHVHPTWYVFAASGLQVLVVIITLRLFEFNKGLTKEQIKKRTQWMRRWGLFSLTVYTLQILEYLPRGILAAIFPASNLDQWTESSVTWVLIFMVVNWLMWAGIMRLWEKLKMKGTFEWLLLNIAKRGKGINKDDPLNVQGILYDCEPIVAFEPEEAAPAE